MKMYVGPLLKRIEGPENEQPYIKLGIFKIRLPFIHYEWEWPEAISALIMMATCLGAAPVLEETLGCSFEVAVTMVIINGFLYMLHAHLGDPVVPGWVTPAIPLVVAYLSQYPMGPARTQALVALNLSFGLLLLILGITGLAKKFADMIPVSVKAGVIFGAGIAAFNSIYAKGGRFDKAPISVTVGVVVALITLFAIWYRHRSEKIPLLKTIRNLGMVPAIIFALIVGPLVGELKVPEIIWSITPLKIKELFSLYSPFSIGFPSLQVIINTLPLTLAVYIIAFGDFVFAQTVIGEADKARGDEKIEFNVNRSNVISGIRNVALGLFAPYTQNAGPLWAAMTVAVAERYKEGKDAMYSIWGGVGTFRVMTFLGLFIYPIVCIMRPALTIAYSVTLLVQAFACSYIAMEEVMGKRNSIAVAVLTGAMIALRGAAWGLLTGILLYLLVERNGKAKAGNK